MGFMKFGLLIFFVAACSNDRPRFQIIKDQRSGADVSKDPSIKPDPKDETDYEGEDGAEEGPDKGDDIIDAPETSKPSPVLKISEKAPSILPDTLEELDIYSKTGVLNAAIPFLPYEVISPLWSDGAAKNRLLLLPKASKITAAPFSNAMVFPAGTIFVKHFTADNPEKTPVETRVILRRPNMLWDYATYKWLPGGLTKRVIVPDEIAADTVWPKGYRIPSESECMKCHNPNAIDVLGFRPEQLVGVLDKLSQEQVISAADLALFKKAVPQQDPKNAELTAEVRALAYLQVNCATCHQPSGLRSTMPFTAKALDWAAMLKVPVTMSTDVVATSPVITPGKPELSKLYLRFTAAKNRMPSGSVHQDPLGEELIKAWIMSIPATCTPAAIETCQTR